MFVQGVPLVVEDGGPLTITNVYQHVCICEVLPMPFHQHASRVRVGQMLFSFQLEAAYLTSDALAEGVLLRHLRDPIIIEFVPPVLHGRLDESKVVAGVYRATMNQNGM